MKTIHEISRCEDFEEYKKMSEANFNLVLHPEARFAAEDFYDRLKIPFIELRRLYQIDKIGSQYQAFGAALGIEFHAEEQKKQAQEAIESFRKVCPDPVSYTHLRAHETDSYLVCRLLLEKKKQDNKWQSI